MGCFYSVASAPVRSVQSKTKNPKKSLDSWARCISGTIPINVYRKALIEAGFQNPEFQVHACAIQKLRRTRAHGSVSAGKPRPARISGLTSLLYSMVRVLLDVIATSMAMRPSFRPRCWRSAAKYRFLNARSSGCVGVRAIG